MKTTLLQKWKIMAGLASLAQLIFASSVHAAMVVTAASQTSGGTFTPSWTVAPSLINGMSPTAQAGNFTANGTSPGLSALTDGLIGSVSTSHTGEANCGGGAGQFVTYTLPAQPDGYNLTNITAVSAWSDGGRFGQGYGVYYSTTANPNNFILLTNVDTIDSYGGSGEVSMQVQISDSAGGVIASNVAEIKFDFDSPNAADENRGTGYQEITVQGTPASTAAPAQTFMITYTNESGSNPFTPDYTVETPNLIAGLLPSSFSGNFNSDGGETVGLSVLTDGSVGVAGTSGTVVSCGANAGTSLVYTLTNSVNGSDVTNIVVYSMWGDSGRDGQCYIVSCSSVIAPNAFIPIATVYYAPNGDGPGGSANAQANRVALFNLNGEPLATNVSKVKFDFAGPPFASDYNNGWQGYSEIVVQGTNSLPPPIGLPPVLVQDTTPSSAETVVGDNVVFTAIYSNTPPAAVQWQQVVGGVTNNIKTGVATVTNNGNVVSTLTLTGVQAASAGTYQLEATNSANATALPQYSTGSPLVVGSTPAAVNNNVIIDYAGQTFLSSLTGYFPSWPVDTNHLNLILGFPDGSGSEGTLTSAYVGAGFGQGGCDADPAILSDGFAYSAYSLANIFTNFCACGKSDYNSGYQVTYSLVTNSASLGLELTNITVFGGWLNSSHAEQKYQVLYSTVQSPGTFVPLVIADYLPTNLISAATVTRTVLVPVNGTLAHNVACVRFNWNVSPNPLNGWSGYSEILIGGIPSTGLAPTVAITPNTASDVVGGQIILTASFNNATSLQWLKNGTNLPGATTSPLTLNNLQLTDSGSYVLAAANAVGTNFSSTCSVTVNPVPAAVSNAIVSIAAQTSVLTPFTPTWDTSVLTSSLIYNTSSSASGLGSFQTPDGNPENAALPDPILTDGSFGSLAGTDKSTITCIGSDLPGSGTVGAGNFVTYTLTGSANGYNITNIMSAGGWSDNGRDQQAYTVYYSTVSSPTYFIPLAVVNYLPSNPVGASATRATITPANGALATNVAAVQFNMLSPAGENGYEGYTELAIYGPPSAIIYPSGPVITVSNEQPASGIPDWVVETTNLIAGQLPASVGPGDFTGGSGCTGVSVLTSGSLSNLTQASSFAACGSQAGTSIIYTNANGWNLTNIIVYSGWANNGRDGQYYNISYSTLQSPATFVPLVSIAYNPIVQNNTNSANRVAIAPPVGQSMLATNVAAVKFDFTPQLGGNATDNGWSGYAQIVLLGTNLPAVVQPTLPTSFARPIVAGGNLILTGSGGTPAGYSYTWLQTTNLTAPVIWTTNVQGVLDGSGAFSNSIPVGTSKTIFFRFRMP